MQARLAPVIRSARRHPPRALITAGLLIAMAATPAAFVPAIYDDFTLVKQASLLVASAFVLVGLALDGAALPRDRPLRFALLAWVACVAVSFSFGIDRAGSVLGLYQYRQGLLTQLAYIALFLGAVSAAGWLPLRVLLTGGMAGLAAVFAYTLVQALGMDPVAWWVDTSVRAIGTIGNANELAAYAVIALAFCGAAQGSRRKTHLAVSFAVAAVSSFIVVESESRSGLVALAGALFLFPVCAFICRRPARRIGLETAALFGPCLLGVAVSLAAGGAAGTADRIGAAFHQSGIGDTTRVLLWRGTVHAIAASPIDGAGPDGLYLAFPVHRPPGFHGAFDNYDITVQSSHNWLLDTAANEGVPGLLALLAVLSIVGWRSVRRERSVQSGIAPYLWSAMAGYVVLTMANPISLAPHAAFFVLLGTLAGRAEEQFPNPAAERPRAWRWIRLAVAGPVAAGLIGLAVLLPLADVRGEAAWEAYADRDFVSGAARAAEAYRLMPLERAYALREANSWLALGVTGNSAALARAEQAYRDIDARFGLTHIEAIWLATAQIGLDEPPETILATIDRAAALSPQGRATRLYLPRLKRAAYAGGTLHWASDSWVFVTANSEVSAQFEPSLGP